MPKWTPEEREWIAAELGPEWKHKPPSIIGPLFRAKGGDRMVPQPYRAWLDHRRYYRCHAEYGHYSYALVSQPYAAAVTPEHIEEMNVFAEERGARWYESTRPGWWNDGVRTFVFIAE
jgi:hypothetical protein